MDDFDDASVVGCEAPRRAIASLVRVPFHREVIDFVGGIAEAVGFCYGAFPFLVGSDSVGIGGVECKALIGVTLEDGHSSFMDVHASFDVISTDQVGEAAGYAEAVDLLGFGSQSGGIVDKAWGYLGGPPNVYAATHVEQIVAEVFLKLV